ncbi:MAG TPA: hypothetical protein EYP49_21680 [Anaerolineae bacterium]|nr:hypothetical protein [Anaerolineae bacterium]
MRFYADEQFDARSVAHLRRKHKVKYVTEFSLLRKRDDAFHHAQSRREKRILVTCDHDLASAKYPVNRHPGVLIIATKPQDYRTINAILDQVLRRFRTAAEFLRNQNHRFDDGLAACYQGGRRERGVGSSGKGRRD